MNHDPKHNWLMMAACMLPLVLVGVLWMLGFNQNILIYGILLLCPLLHILMMKGHHSEPHTEEET